MDSFFRAVAIYLLLLIIFRISGKRSLSQVTTFDFVLLLIISEAISNALHGNDYSITNAIILVITLIGMDIGFSLLKQRSKTIDKLIDSVPLVIVDNGNMLRDRMDKSRISEDDILSKAREFHGLENMDQIKYAVLERSGSITIIPKN